MCTPRLYPKRTLNRGGLPEVISHLTRKLAPALVFLCLAPAAASASPAEATPLHTQGSTTLWAAATPPDDEQWEDLMIWYLLWLYDSMGGDADALDHESIAECMEGVSDYYSKHGVPTSISESHRGNFRNAIETTAFLMDAAPSGGLPNQTGSFVEVLQEMYSDVGGDPDTLL